jgi:hypothetical protein
MSTVTPKFFVCKITGITFSVNEGGSSYKMTAMPFNHLGFSDTVNTVYNDVKIVSGEEGTVEELLSTGEVSLAAVLNGIEKRLKEDEQIGIEDEYVIEFPKDSSTTASVSSPLTDLFATLDPNKTAAKAIKGTGADAPSSSLQNEISQSEFGFTQASGGTFAMKLDGEQRDEETGIVIRDNMTIDPKTRAFQFAQGQSITSIINQVILSSEYAKSAIDPINKTADGFVKWWRIDVQIKLLDFDAVTGDFAKRFTYRVVPFYVHESIFSNPNSAPIGYGSIQNKVSKVYKVYKVKR